MNKTNKTNKNSATELLTLRELKNVSGGTDEDSTANPDKIKPTVNRATAL